MLILAGPRYEALGGIYSVAELSTDGPGGNPAAIAANGRSHLISAHATRYWVGLPGDALYSSRLGYTTPRMDFGVLGLEFKQFGLGLHSSFGLGLGYAYPIFLDQDNILSLGIYGRWLRNQYDLSQSYRLEEDPLFDNYGDASDGFGLDIGAKYNYRNFTAGLAGINIVRPNISLSGESGEGNTEPSQIALGMAYTPFDWVTPAIQASWDEEEGLLGSVGAEFHLLEGLIDLRTGYREGNFTFGLGIKGSVSIPISFDYAMSYPDGALSKAGMTTHSIGVTAIIPQKKVEPQAERVPWIDLIARRVITMEDTLVFSLDMESTFQAEILNSGTATADSFYVTAYRTTPETTLIGTPRLIDTLAPGQKIEVSWKITPLEGGLNNLLIIADRDSFGAGKIAELNEENNRLLIPYYIAGDVVAKVDVEYTQLKINELTYIREEEPLVPIIFFEKGSDQVSSRFFPVLEEIAKRMKENPDLMLGLSGFVDKGSDPQQWRRTELHIRRAEAVAQKIVEFGAPEESIEIIKEGYDPTRVRAGTAASYESAQDRLWVQQENRRVEMEAWVRDYRGPIITIDFEDPGLQVKESTLDSLSMFACEANIFLEENPAITLVLEGYTSSEHDFNEVYDLLDELRNYILDEITCPIDESRFPIVVDRGEKEETEVKLFMTGEGLIFRPIENALAAKDYEIPENMQKNEVEINVASGWVKEYKVIVIDSEGKTVNTLATGEGIPPEVLYWNWKDKNGNLVDPRKSYHIDLISVDAVGGVSRFSSDEIKIQVTEIERRKESAIIVQFAFDEVTSTSRFLESRIENMARRVKKAAEDPNTELTIRIIGHTDPIGTDRRNMVLSQERAAKEERNFRRYLRYIVGVENDVELDRWLSKHDATLIRQGQADKDPYEVERYRDGDFEKVLLGNNAYPEGRSINRRVIIQFEEKIIK